MAVDNYKNFPERVLEDSYLCKASENIVEGMMVVRDSATGLVKKAVGAADEYAMLAMNDQSERFMENANKINCVKENGSFLTNQFKVGPSYTYGCKLQVSAAGGEEGLLTIHDGGATRPIVGRYQGIKVMDQTDGNANFMIFDLVRSY